MNSKLKNTLKKIENGIIKDACVYYMLEAYYRNESLPEEVSVPVGDRSSGIGEALHQLIAVGHDVNESGEDFNALMLAVEAADSQMVHFLLSHGADANTWPNMAETPKELGNLYLDNIDLYIMIELLASHSDMEYIDALLRTAVVLAKEAHLGPFDGCCLAIDIYKRAVLIKLDEMLY